MSLPAELVLSGPRSLRGTLSVPGDKSMSHRALIFAAIAEGRSTLRNLAPGEDVQHTRRVLDQLGVRARASANAVIINGVGFAGLREPELALDCGNSGTAMRLFAGLLAGRDFLSVLSGDASLSRRPMRRVVEPLRAMGATIDGREGGEFAPLAIRGAALTGMRHELAIASAQVKSALILAGLQAVGVTEIVEPVLSRDHTERMLAALGAPVTVADGVVTVKAGQPGPSDFEVPGDPSSSAFFAVAASITPESDITLTNVCTNPTRLGFVDVLRRMGADIDVRVTGEVVGEPIGDLHVRAAPLEATVIEGDEIPRVLDEIPALAIAAAFADGVTEIRDAAELRVKETDRIGTIEQELSQLSIEVETRADGLVIRGGLPRAGLMKSHGDHRIALAAVVAANALPGESTVRGWRAAAVSYPSFADDLAMLRGER